MPNWASSFRCVPHAKSIRQLARELRRLTGGKAIRSQGRCRQRQGLKEGLVSTVNIAKANRFWRSAGVRLQKVPADCYRLETPDKPLEQRTGHYKQDIMFSTAKEVESNYRHVASTIMLYWIRFNRSRVRGPYARFCERDKDGIKEYYPIFTLFDWAASIFHEKHVEKIAACFLGNYSWSSGFS